jgi:hypothetical protein
MPSRLFFPLSGLDTNDLIEPLRSMGFSPVIAILAIVNFIILQFSGTVVLDLFV